MYYLKNSIGMQLKLMCCKKGFQLSFLINMVVALLIYLYHVFSAWGQDVSKIVSPSAAFMLLDTNSLFEAYITLVPFIVVLPFAMSFVTDRSNMVLPALQTRGSVKTYYIAKAIACFAGGMIVFLIPCAMNIILNNLTFPQSGVTFVGDLYDWNYNAHLMGINVAKTTKWVGIWFPRIYINHPEVYNIIIAMFFSVSMGIFSVFSYAVSFYLTKHKILLFVPLYVVVVLFNTLDMILVDIYPYTCTKIMMYITGNTMYGKNPMFLYTFFVCMGLVTVVLLSKQIGKDQIE